MMMRMKKLIWSYQEKAQEERNLSMEKKMIIILWTKKNLLSTESGAITFHLNSAKAPHPVPVILHASGEPLQAVLQEAITSADHKSSLIPCQRQHILLCRLCY